MVSKDLKKLSRRDLIDIIYQMKKNEQKMEEEISSLKSELEEKRLHISNAGSIADAAVSLTKIFSKAQETADLYLDEISNLKETTEKECKQMVDEANETVSKILSDGKKKFAILQERYKADHEKWKQLRETIDTLKSD